ncbi:hypothetical protein [Vibrio owensii]|uniref:hypothetical protein n=1 Tax=Vibrio harveyi group TaxID=717610 RepID=UPI003CC61F8C
MDNNALFFTFKPGSSLPSNAPSQIAITADTMDDVKNKLAKFLEMEPEHVRILFIDSLDSANHQYDTQISTEFGTIYANTCWGNVL